MAGIVNTGGSSTLPVQEEWNQKVRTAHELGLPIRSSSDETELEQGKINFLKCADKALIRAIH